MNPHIAKLFIYPIKSLDPVAVERATMLETGALKLDRRWSIFDASGNFVNGKRYVQIHSLRAKYDLETLVVSLWKNNSDVKVSFSLIDDLLPLAAWLSDYFHFPVTVQQNLQQGFPDDTQSPGPTIISTATLETVASWYPGLEIEELRRRFRSNIEIGGVPAFWEDRLFAAATSNFCLGNVHFLGINPCQRCIVVSRHSETGKPYPNFSKTFNEQRQANLPQWTERSHFNHFFRLAVNTRVCASEAGKTLHLADPFAFLPK